MSGPALSVVLPTYNEAASIERFLAELFDVLERSGRSHEIVLVDDASPDGTADCVERTFSRNESLRLIRRCGDRGLAASVREGVEAARGEVLVVMDADFNHDPQVLPALLDPLASCDLVSGSRFVPGGGMYSRARQAGSFVMNELARRVLETGIRDNLSGYFATRRSSLLALPLDRIFYGYGDYYFRLLWFAQREGMRLREVPVVYRSREGGGSKTPLLRTTIRYARAILAFRLEIAGGRA